MVVQLPNVASMFWMLQLFPRHVENNEVANPTSGGGRQKSILYRAVTHVQCEERFCYGSSEKIVITNIGVKIPTISSGEAMVWDCLCGSTGRLWENGILGPIPSDTLDQILTLNGPSPR
jgi:hypothetical protein